MKIFVLISPENFRNIITHVSGLKAAVKSEIWATYWDRSTVKVFKLCNEINASFTGQSMNSRLILVIKLNDWEHQNHFLIKLSTKARVKQAKKNCFNFRRVLLSVMSFSHDIKLLWWAFINPHFTTGRLPPVCLFSVVEKYFHKYFNSFEVSYQISFEFDFLISAEIFSSSVFFKQPHPLKFKMNLRKIKAARSLKFFGKKENRLS